MAASRPTTGGGATGTGRTRDEASADHGADQPPSAGPDRPNGQARIFIDDRAGALDARTLGWLEGALGRAAAEALMLERSGGAGGADHEVRVRIVGDGEMGALHAAHTGDATTTDVLTFDLRDDDGAALDVDIVVCADEARRQALARGGAVERELLLYALHGVLHCLGHDDHDDDAFARMHAREDEILTRIGVGALFAGSGGEAAP